MNKKHLHDFRGRGQVRSSYGKDYRKRQAWKGYRKHRKSGFKEVVCTPRNPWGVCEARGVTGKSMPVRVCRRAPQTRASLGPAERCMFRQQEPCSVSTSVPQTRGQSVFADIHRFSHEQGSILRSAARQHEPVLDLRNDACSQHEVEDVQKVTYETMLMRHIPVNTSLACVCGVVVKTEPASFRERCMCVRKCEACSVRRNAVRKCSSVGGLLSAYGARPQARDGPEFAEYYVRRCMSASPTTARSPGVKNLGRVAIAKPLYLVKICSTISKNLWHHF